MKRVSVLMRDITVLTVVLIYPPVGPGMSSMCTVVQRVMVDEQYVHRCVTLSTPGPGPMVGEYTTVIPGW